MEFHDNRGCEMALMLCRTFEPLFEPERARDASYT